MDFGTLVTNTISDEEGVDPNDTYYSGLRAEMTRRANERSDDLWVSYDWPFKKTAPVTVTVTSGVGNGYAALPSNFDAFGHAMTVVVNGKQFPPLVWRQLGDIMAERQRWAGGVAYPTMFAIAEETDLGIKSIAVAPYLSNDVDLDIVFDKTPPTLVDSTTPPTGLESWPIAFHQSVIKQLLVQEMMRKKGDIRADTSQEAKVQAAVKRMIRDQMPGRGAVQRMPPHPAARRHYGRSL
jgi:hypothetical protein